MWQGDRLIEDEISGPLQMHDQLRDQFEEETIPGKVKLDPAQYFNVLSCSK
jgi:hypothetical protein